MSYAHNREYRLAPNSGSSENNENVLFPSTPFPLLLASTKNTFSVKPVFHGEAGLHILRCLINAAEIDMGL